MVGGRMPGMSHLFGIHPWQWQRLTWAEISVYIDAYDRHIADLEADARKAKQAQSRARRR